MESEDITVTVVATESHTADDPRLSSPKALKNQMPTPSAVAFNVITIDDDDEEDIEGNKDELDGVTERSSQPFLLNKDTNVPQVPLKGLSLEVLGEKNSDKIKSNKSKKSNKKAKRKICSKVDEVHAQIAKRLKKNGDIILEFKGKESLEELIERIFIFPLPEDPSFIKVYEMLQQTGIHVTNCPRKLSPEETETLYLQLKQDLTDAGAFDEENLGLLESRGSTDAVFQSTNDLLSVLESTDAEIKTTEREIVNGDQNLSEVNRPEECNKSTPAEATTAYSSDSDIEFLGEVLNTSPTQGSPSSGAGTSSNHTKLVNTSREVESESFTHDMKPTVSHPGLKVTDSMTVSPGPGFDDIDVPMQPELENLGNFLPVEPLVDLGEDPNLEKYLDATVSEPSSTTLTTEKSDENKDTENINKSENCLGSGYSLERDENNLVTSPVLTENINESGNCLGSGSSPESYYSAVESQNEVNDNDSCNHLTLGVPIVPNMTASTSTSNKPISSETLIDITSTQSAQVEFSFENKASPETQSLSSLATTVVDTTDSENDEPLAKRMRELKNQSKTPQNNEEDLFDQAICLKFKCPPCFVKLIVLPAEPHPSVVVVAPPSNQASNELSSGSAPYKRGRGRPKSVNVEKSKVHAETVDTIVVNLSPRKRGRPRKNLSPDTKSETSKSEKSNASSLVSARSRSPKKTKNSMCSSTEVQNMQPEKLINPNLTTVVPEPELDDTGAHNLNLTPRFESKKESASEETEDSKEVPLRRKTKIKAYKPHCNYIQTQVDKSVAVKATTNDSVIQDTKSITTEVIVVDDNVNTDKLTSEDHVTNLNETESSALNTEVEKSTTLHFVISPTSIFEPEFLNLEQNESENCSDQSVQLIENSVIEELTSNNKEELTTIKSNNIEVLEISFGSELEDIHIVPEEELQELPTLPLLAFTENNVLINDIEPQLVNNQNQLSVKERESSSQSQEATTSKVLTQLSSVKRKPGPKSRTMKKDESNKTGDINQQSDKIQLTTNVVPDNELFNEVQTAPPRSTNSIALPVVQRRRTISSSSDSDGYVPLVNKKSLDGSLSDKKRNSSGSVTKGGESDDDKWDIYLKKMAVECSKEIPKIDYLKWLIEKTRIGRKKAFEDLNLDIDDGLELFPALKIYTILKEEFNYLTMEEYGTNCPLSMKVLEEKLEDEIINALETRKQPGLVRHKYWEKARKEFASCGETISTEKRKILGMICLCFYLADDADAAATRLFSVRKNDREVKWKEISTPRLDIIKEELLVEDAKAMWIYAEGLKHIQVPNVYEGVLTIFALHFFFRVEYDNKLKPIFQHFEKLARSPKSSSATSATKFLLK